MLDFTSITSHNDLKYYLTYIDCCVSLLLFFCNTAGLIPSDKVSASYPLRKKGGGNAVVIAVGGAPEALDAHPGTYNVLLAEKKGFIKMAMEHG